MKSALVVFILASIPYLATASPVESKSDEGAFAISLAGACELMKDRGFTADKLKSALVNQQGMNSESADLLVSYSSQWIAKNPGKSCDQVYIDIIDELSAKQKN